MILPRLPICKKGSGGGEASNSRGTPTSALALFDVEPTMTSALSDPFSPIVMRECIVARNRNLLEEFPVCSGKEYCPNRESGQIFPSSKE